MVQYEKYMNKSITFLYTSNDQLVNVMDKGDSFHSQV